jgi:hypothetical protein
MAENLLAQINKIRTSITNLESQRSILGDETVNIALIALQQQLSTLEAEL